MAEQLEQLLAQLTVWLNQTLPLYWLVAAVIVALVYIALMSTRARRRLRLLDAERQSLNIGRAADEQKLDSFMQTNAVLSAKVDENGLLISKLIADSSELKSSRNEKLQQLQDSEKERLGLREMLENNQRKVARLEADVREQTARLQSEQEKLVELKSQFELQKRELKTEFKVVSEEIMKERQLMLAEQNKEGVGALLKPLRDQIDGFQKRVNEVHDESVKGNTSLKSEIENVMKMGIKMRDEASSLATALKGDSQQRGAWGEAQLERTLELSGLVENDHYQKQTSFTDNSGRRKQTDFIIKLPDNKCIVIDSKVSLNAYEQAMASSVEDQAAALRRHTTAVRAHINDLAKKEYTNLDGIHSPDFILMFMPIEPAYIEAMKQDTELFSFGYEQNVVLVSHTTLIPILRTVANLWMLDRGNKEARLLGEKAGDIYNSVALISERLLKLGKTLNTASGHFKDSVTSLSGLQGKVERFSTLSNKASKSMPALDDTQLEFDTSKLTAQALPEPVSAELKQLESADTEEPSD